MCCAPRYVTAHVLLRGCDCDCVISSIQESGCQAKRTCSVAIVGERGERSSVRRPSACNGSIASGERCAREEVTLLSESSRQWRCPAAAGAGVTVTVRASRLLPPISVEETAISAVIPSFHAGWRRWIELRRSRSDVNNRDLKVLLSVFGPVPFGPVRVVIIDGDANRVITGSATIQCQRVNHDVCCSGQTRCHNRNDRNKRSVCWLQLCIERSNVDAERWVSGNAVGSG